MEDKSSSVVEKEQLADLKNMLLISEQQNPSIPDYYAQIALSKLIEISRDYQKSRDCIFTAIKTRVNNPWEDWINLAYNLIRDNQPTQALEIAEILSKEITSSSCRINSKTISGIVNMYLGNYKEAGQFLLDALNQLSILWKKLEIYDLEKNTLWSELRLCIELMHRQDLLDLFEEKNLMKLCEEFNFHPIGTVRKPVTAPHGGYFVKQ